MSAPDETPVEETPVEHKHRNWWIWVSVGLAIVAIVLLGWGLSLQSDLDSTQKDLDAANDQLAAAQKDLDSAKQDVASLQAEADSGPDAAGVVAAAGALYTKFADELDATNADLEATQKQLEDAQKAAEKADKDAAAAKDDAANANNETEKAQAEAAQAQAELEAAEARASIAKDCAKASISALGPLFESDDPDELAPEVRDQLESIAADCKEQLAD